MATNIHGLKNVTSMRWQNIQHVQQHFVPLTIQQLQLKHETYAHLTAEELVHRVQPEHNEQSGSVNTEKNITEFDHPLSVTSPAAPGVEPSINSDLVRMPGKTN